MGIFFLLDERDNRNKKLINLIEAGLLTVTLRYVLLHTIQGSGGA